MSIYNAFKYNFFTSKPLQVIMALSLLMFISFTSNAMEAGVAEKYVNLNDFDASSRAYNLDENTKVVINIASNIISVVYRDRKTINDISNSIVVNGKVYKPDTIKNITTGKHWIRFERDISDANLLSVYRLSSRDGCECIFISHSLVDKHINNKTDAQWDKYWSNRIISNNRLILDTINNNRESRIRQINSFSGGAEDEAYIVEYTNTGTVHWKAKTVGKDIIQLEHDHDNSNKTYLEIYPKYNGTTNLILHQVPLSSPYPAANDIDVVIRHHDGISVINNVDQSMKSNDLGRFKLDSDSSIKILARGSNGDRIIFGNLTLLHNGGVIKVIRPNRVDDDLYENNDISISIKDFWKKYPIEFIAKNKRLIIDSILHETAFYGGAGATIDIGLSFNQKLHNSRYIKEIMRNPPEFKLPLWWSPLDGEVISDARYLRLLNKLPNILINSDDYYSNYGWKNYGDYQIGPSFHSDTGEKIENWASLQYDLALGLILSWASTNDNYLWNRAQAAVRNIMDTQIVKFSPYAQKRSGAGIRKGECSTDISHWCQEPIPEFNYHTRALLLYSHITGETWPRDIAHMVIDNSAYFANSRPEWTVTHSRIAAWSLRNLYYGAKVFPDGSKYNYSHEKGFKSLPKGTKYEVLLSDLTDRLVSEIERIDRIPGQQPVWQGQVVEGLIIAYESGYLSKELTNRTYNAIVNSVDNFVHNQLRITSQKYEIMYILKRDLWTDAATYAWFWLNTLHWVSSQESYMYNNLINDLYEWLYKEYTSNNKYQNVRAFTGVVSFPSYFINRKH